VNAVDISGDKLPYMESLYKQVKDEAEKLLQYIRQPLENCIEDLKYKISILDKLRSLVNKSAGENINNYRSLMTKRIEQKS
jgi:2-hydroxy-3-keto-5-methylthiopentenyl-1-phosphate phosphatase